MSREVIAEILTQLGLDDTMTSEEKQRIVNYQGRDGSYLLSQDKPELFTEIINQLANFSPDELLAQWDAANDDRDVMIKSPFIQPQRDALQMQIDNLQKKLDIEKGIYQCDRCGKNETIGIEKQIRSADEPMSTKVRCLNCGKNWIIG